jgi:hypothetical protein
MYITKRKNGDSATDIAFSLRYFEEKNTKNKIV